MATTVYAAFKYFMTEIVNLNPTEVESGRSSRSWLVNQIHSFDGAVTDFPTLFCDYDINYGSFERKTQKREIDDIDLIIGLNAQGCSYYEYTDRIELITCEYSPTLKKYCHELTNKINSKRIVNKFVSALSTVAQYRRADIGRNGEAAVLDLTSYTWSFDIVPAFMTTTDAYGKSYYLVSVRKLHFSELREDQDI